MGEAEDGLEGVEKIEALRPDLLFLDIEMPGLTGFEVLRSIQGRVPLPLVIFVTGYDQHALAAFAADALAYLLKPVEAERLALAVERARKLATAGDEVERSALDLQAARELPRPLPYVGRAAGATRRPAAIPSRSSGSRWRAASSGPGPQPRSFWVN